MWWILIKLAWRNLFRNTRRTFIAGTAIGIGLAALIFVDALWIGMEENMIRIATSSFLGDGQIHQEDFRQTQEVERTINLRLFFRFTLTLLLGKRYGPLLVELAT